MIVMPASVQALLRENTPESYAVAMDWFEENQLRRPTANDRKTLFGVRGRGLDGWQYAQYPFDVTLSALFTIDPVAKTIKLALTGLWDPSPRVLWSIEDMRKPDSAIMWLKSPSIAARWTFTSRVWFIPTSVQDITTIGGTAALEISGNTVVEYEQW